MTDVIILHGAWHQPAHYDGLCDELRSQGLRVEVPDLYGLSLADSTTLVEDIVAHADRAPLVLGHSFGGVTAATVRGTAGIVFLTAWLLDAGESPAQLLAEVEKQDGAPPSGLALVPDDAGRLGVDPADARVNLYGDVDDDTAARAVELLRPEPPSIFAATPARVSWRDVPSLYIAGRDDHAIPASLAARFAARCDTSQTWQCSHSPFLSRTSAVADVVHQQLRSARR
ncbi:alpha/beta fold hydrolase [Catenulispora pinisilvae]|uniref:alpha/beta fold hydrolase n=1 Tax=Catenulispora pinisilvae TaxID=2705253 RepID=UPI0018927AEB|nr:alpha/beta hydrolase [Catenulispora pinisilvae]